jgi:hypothetical protein
MTRVVCTLLCACTALSAAGVNAQEPYKFSPYGADVVVVRRQQAGPIRGELIAASADSVWVLDNTALRGVPLASVQQVDIRRFNSGASTAWTWAIAGGLVSAGALTAACSSVEDTSGCGIILPLMMVPWLAWGWGGAASLGGSSRRSLRPAASVLRAYSRFPQGLPPDLDIATLRVGVSLPLPRP